MGDEEGVGEANIQAARIRAAAVPCHAGITTISIISKDILGYPIVIGVKVRGYRRYLEEIEETER